MLPSAVSDSRVHNILPNKIETDFQFSRASAATRVNHQGLIENVGYFSDELVQNGNFSELGPEIITNGDNIQESEWTLGVGWSVSNGKLVADTNSNSACEQSDSFTTGKTYKIVFTVSNYVSGQVRPQLTGSGSANGQNVSANGTYTQYIVAIANHNKFRFQATSNNFTGSISNVSVKQVDPDDDWVINGEWEYVDNGVSITNATGGYNDSALYQLITLDTSKTYKVNINVSSITGLLQVYTGAYGNGFSVTTSGEISFTLDLTSYGDRINLLPGNGSDVVIKSFSLVEVIGDKPRLDYDPTNPTCPHLLLEPQSTNLVTFSEDFSGYTTNNSSISSNVISSPDGSLSASKLIENTATAEHTIQKQVSVTSGNAYSISVFVKKDEISSVQFGFTGSNFASPTRSIFDIENGIITINVSNTASIQNYGNGWYKLKVTNTTNATGTAMLILQTIKSGQANYTGDGVSGFYMWGLQWEQQTYCTSYIPTAGAAETRVAETCTNAGNVDTFNSTEGVLYAEIQALANNQTVRKIALSDGDGNPQIAVGYDALSNQIRAIVFDGTFPVDVVLSTTAYDILEYHKVAIKYKSGDSALWVDGTEVETSTNAFTIASSLNTLNFDDGGGGSDFYGKVKGLATYNRALTDTELYTITSTQYSAYSGMVAALGNYTIPC